MSTGKEGGAGHSITDRTHGAATSFNPAVPAPTLLSGPEHLKNNGINSLRGTKLKQEKRKSHPLLCLGDCFIEKDRKEKHFKQLHFYNYSKSTV